MGNFANVHRLVYMSGNVFEGQNGFTFPDDHVISFEENPLVRGTRTNPDQLAVSDVIYPLAEQILNILKKQRREQNRGIR